MLKSKKIKNLALLALASFALVGCDDEVKLPTNYEDPIYDVSNIVDNGNKVPVIGNDYEHYYNAVTSSNDVYAKAANQILLDISKVAHGYGDSAVSNHDVTSVVADTYEGSVSDSYDKVASVSKDNLAERAKKSMVTTAKGGSYSKDNLFYERKYARYLSDSYYYLDINLDEVSNTGKFLTAENDYEDIFDTTKEFYNQYMQEELYDDMRINYLTAEYIYTKSPASIGNSNARNVQIIGLTDRTDKPGAAKKLLDAYIKDYIKGEKKDPDFYVLSRLWKGITAETANKIDADRYGAEIILTADEEQWLRNNGVLPSDKKFDAVTSDTLTGKVLSDIEKLEAGKDDYNRLDATLESTYTGSYTYDINTGIRKAIDEIAKSNLITKGIYLSSSGISSIPSDLSSRIFSPKLTTNKNDIAAMKENPGTKKDISLYGNDGYRYLTIADTLTGTNDDIIYYDADSKTYYLTRILDVVNTSALSSTSTTTVYDTAEKKEQISREVAYAMSTTGSYKTNAAVYWLSRTKINYSDDDFLEYMKSTYKDVFKADNPYTPTEDKDWIVLGK